MNFVMVAQGWQCPCCQRVYSPTTPMCFHCPPKVSSGGSATPVQTLPMPPCDYQRTDAPQVSPATTISK